MKRTTVYTVKTKRLPKTKKCKAYTYKYVDPVEGYEFEKYGLTLHVYKFAPGQWYVIDPLTGAALGGTWDTRAKALEYGASEHRCSKLAEYRKSDEYANLRLQFAELKEAIA